MARSSRSFDWASFAFNLTDCETRRALGPRLDPNELCQPRILFLRLFARLRIPEGIRASAALEGIRDRALADRRRALTTKALETCSESAPVRQFESETKTPSTEVPCVYDEEISLLLKGCCTSMGVWTDGPASSAWAVDTIFQQISRHRDHTRHTVRYFS